MPRTRPSFRFAVVSLLLLFASVRSSATSVIAPPFESLVAQAGYVVRATVRSVEPEWRATPGQPGQRHIVSVIKLDVHEAIKGRPPRMLVLEAVGGRIGDDELRIAGSPVFRPGEEGIFFVHSRRYFSPLVALQHGLYPVRRNDRTGRDMVVRANGRPLYHEQDVSRPMAAPSIELARNPSAQPLTSAQFAARIRAVADRPARETQR